MKIQSQSGAICLGCKKSFEGWCHRRKRCEPCATIRNKGKRKEWKVKNLTRHREIDKEYQRKMRASGLKDKTKEYNEWKYKNPEKVKAQQTLNQGIRMGRIIKPKTCDKCKEIGYIHGHHPDYSMPLEVEWLCASCHQLTHIMNEQNELKEGIKLQNQMLNQVYEAVSKPKKRFHVYLEGNDGQDYEKEFEADSMGEAVTMLADTDLRDLDIATITKNTEEVT